MGELVGRDPWTGKRLRVVHDGSRVERLELWGGATTGGAEEPWLSPALWDLQINGGLGISFSDAELTVEQVRRVCDFVRPGGVGRFCPTLITAAPEAMRRGVETIAAACEQDAVVRQMVLGIHLEGPAISDQDGYRGAHPAEQVRDLSWEEFARLQDASGGRVVLVTLAPERTGMIEFIRRATASGVVVALGHTAADGATIRAAVDAGARLSTHLGNGVGSPLPRHPNPIWQQAAEDRLWASLIADGVHLDDCTLKVLARAKGFERTILVSDLSPLAGLPAGRYGAWEVGDDGVIRVAGTEFLAGAAQPLIEGVRRLARTAGWPIPEAIAAATLRPAQLLGRPAPRLEPGAEFVAVEPVERVGFASDP
ncbi:MAG: hypothetical protein KatS3mg108_1849 [Isosphaeraceae bacterium]|jgi:N-acetylglucosamine-6-phosphate deacetylase|nr:MAG: hypothetical protein KatS3mg108_1849 [Isosphaeraceae bacterium]